MIIGLTGGIASGKSTVSNILRKQDVYIIDADKLVHQILQKGNRGYKKVVDQFGEKILNSQNQIDRNKLGQIVFSDKKKLKKLENITHPLVISIIKDKIESKQDDYEHIVVDAPLLYESGLDKLTDQDWVVYADYDVQLKRLMERDDLSREEAKNRIEKQLSLEKKRELADVVINNNDSIADLKEKVLHKWKKLIVEKV
mgnify:CR=1 FL=1